MIAGLNQGKTYTFWCGVLLAFAVTPLQSLAQGGERVDYQGSHSTERYHVTIRAIGAFSEKTTSWYMDVSDKASKPLISDYVFSPFYAWTCIVRGKAYWASDSVLHFMNLSAQGRCVDFKLKNKTEHALPYTEVWVRSVDREGYPHSPSICLFFDMKNGESQKFWPEIFPGAEYFMVRCEVEGKMASSHFRVPAKQGWPHDIDLDDPGKHISIELLPSGPLIHGGAFEALTLQEANALAPDGPRLHLSEGRGQPYKVLDGKTRRQHNKPSGGDVQ